MEFSRIFINCGKDMKKAISVYKDRALEKLIFQMASSPESTTLWMVSVCVECYKNITNKESESLKRACMELTSSLAHYGRTDLLEHLHKCGFPIHFTALYYALEGVHERRFDTVMFLWKLGGAAAVQSYSNVTKCTAVCMAIQTRQREFVGTFLQTPDLDLSASCQTHSPYLHLLCDNNMFEFTRQFFRAGASLERIQGQINELLFVAASRGEMDAVKAYIEYGSDVNSQNNSKLSTALMAAVEAGHKRIVRLLVASGADPNLRNSDGVTAMLLAAEKGLDDIVQFLLEFNAHPDMPQREGITPLIAACTRGFVGIARQLLIAGAFPGALYNREPLIVYSTKNDFKAQYGEDAAGLKTLIADYATNIDQRKIVGTPRTALGIALRYGWYNDVKLLLHRGASKFAALQHLNRPELHQVSYNLICAWPTVLPLRSLALLAAKRLGLEPQIPEIINRLPRTRDILAREAARRKRTRDDPSIESEGNKKQK